VLILKLLHLGLNKRIIIDRMSGKHLNFKSESCGAYQFNIIFLIHCKVVDAPPRL